MLKYLQKIGKALMVPVAVLPAAAILMGIGYWIDPTGWGANSQVAALLIKAGGSLIDSMGILFAVGVAFGMSKDQHGSAALSGLVGFLVLTTLLSPGAVAALQHIDIADVPAAFGKINNGNQFIGILVGVISSALYNKFSKVELHKSLSFFSGKRLVPIITAAAMIVVSFVLMFLWPLLFNGLVKFGTSIVGLGPLGAGIYGFFNRLLIPVGLHHALNSVFWFDVAGINDLGNFWAGKAVMVDGKNVTGMYMGGFFPIMMFGLLGAAAAFIKTSKPKNKAKVTSIMIAAGFATFFTGITEPMEFSFMFLAPGLYLIHALLTGLSLFIAASMHWIAGFGFSAGLVDFVLSSRLPLANMPYMLILQGFVFMAIYYFVFTFAITKWDLKTPGREDDEEDAEEIEAPTTHTATAKLILEYIGGKNNLLEIDSCATRLRLEVKDQEIIQDAKIKKITSGILKPGKTSVQIIIGPHAQFICDELKKLVK
jgi:PTS system N-acetylglucosamine-specific IIC component